ncbi:MAG: TlpA disulfide reductase family protein [Thermoleophilia bacterium]|nr:TlpA disulfide reductase family protein [Thermoleophilia bacterium]
MIFLAGCGDSGSSSGTNSGSSAPKTAPDFTVKTLSGESVSYSSLKGKPLVLNFAASWCGPCELEAPVLAKMYEKYKDKANFFGIAVRDNEEDQRAFAESHGLKFPIGLDPDSKVLYSYQKAGKVNMSGIPTTFFIDKDGTIQAFFIGPISESTFDQRISTILN